MIINAAIKAPSKCSRRLFLFECLFINQLNSLSSMSSWNCSYIYLKYLQMLRYKSYHIFNILDDKQLCLFLNYSTSSLLFWKFVSYIQNYTIDLYKFMKYSSSPNLIKHYVPLDFSKGCIDYKQKKSCEKVFERTDENPFKNKKLQKIHKGVKDFVLVFKNKSVQKFKAQKKIAYSPLLKQICFDQERREKAMKHKTQLISKKDFLCNYKPKFKLNTNTPHPKTVQPEKTSRKRNLSQRKVRQSQVLERKSSLKTPTGTLRSTRYSWRGFQEKQNSQELELGLANQQQPFKSHKSLKIQGNRAPKSETIDYFRKLHKYESGQYFTMGLFNSFQGQKQY